MKSLAKIHCQLSYKTYGFYIITIYVKYRRKNNLCNIGAIGRRTAIHVIGSKTNLVIYNKMYSASGFVTIQLTHLYYFVNNALSGNGSIPGFSIPGRPPVSARERPSAFAYRVSPDYFKAMGIVLRQGRVPVASDGPGTPVAVINDVLAERFFPGENPVGQRIELDGAAREIVGVVGGVKHYTLAEAVQPQIYTPLAHRPTNRLYFVVRFDRAVVGDSLPGSLRAVVRAVNPNQPIALLSPLDDFVAARMSGQRLALALFATFSLAALLLAGIGIYGVMAYSVAQRTGEIGLRMALGAEHRDVLRLVATQGGRLIGFGLAAGLIGTLVLSRLIQSVLQSLFTGAGTNDPIVFAGVALLLGLVGLIACLVPARRAARIDPVIALRAE